MDNIRKADESYNDKLINNNFNDNMIVMKNLNY